MTEDVSTVATVMLSSGDGEFLAALVARGRVLVRRPRSLFRQSRCFLQIFHLQLRFAEVSREVLQRLLVFVASHLQLLVVRLQTFVIL